MTAGSNQAADLLSLLDLVLVEVAAAPLSLALFSLLELFSVELFSLLEPFSLFALLSPSVFEASADLEADDELYRSAYQPPPLSTKPVPPLIWRLAVCP